jgi:hypothetical protein
VTNPFPPKELTCICGNTFVSEQRSNWCRACGKQVFYDAKDNRTSKFNRIYIIVLMVVVIGLVGFFFIEMIITPIVHLQNP